MTTQQPDPLLLTIDQTAALLCYHRNTIHEMIRRGELKTVGQRKSRRVIRASVDRWIKQQSQ